MKLLAFSDRYIPHDVMQQGLQLLEPFGVEIDVRRWEHATLVDLQRANLAIEQGGPNAVELPSELTREIDNVDVIVTQFAPINRRLIEMAPSLKVIGVLRGGTENVDVPLATGHGICVMNTPGRNARAVAEATLGMILAEIRNLARSHASLKNAQWRREFPNRDAIPELCGKTIGLVGYGAVGQLVAQYLHAFGSHILAFDPFFHDDPAPAILVNLEDLLRQSDIISIHARLTPENHHLIGREQLALMKPSAVLVNTARSGLVDERELIIALSQRRIMGAALDVFDVEPLPPGHPLLELDNVTITPHLAGSTSDAFRNSPRLMARHLQQWLQGKEDLPIVNDVPPPVYSGRCNQ